MSREGGKSGRSMTPDEAELWDRLGQSVDKVKNKPRVTPHDNIGAPAPPPRAQVALEPEHKRPKPPSAAKVEQPAPKPRRLPPLAEFDRRSVRQVASGKIGIDAHLDLHGVRRRDARAQLHAFLFACQQSGCKTVLVVTGKGEESDNRDHLADALGEPRRGVLRRLVPQWLEEPELRTVVLSFTSAGVRHGGSGALYVQLRRRSRE